MEILEAIDRLDDQARAVPLTDQVRIDRIEVLDGIATIRRHADGLDRPGAMDPAVFIPSPWDPVLEAFDEIRKLMDAAPRRLLARALKIDAEALRHAAARIRSAAIQNLGPPDRDAGPLSGFYAAVDDLDALARGEGTLKLPYDALADLLERILSAMDAD